MLGALVSGTSALLSHTPGHVNEAFATATLTGSCSASVTYTTATLAEGILGQSPSIFTRAFVGGLGLAASTFTVWKMVSPELSTFHLVLASTGAAVGGLLGGLAPEKHGRTTASTLAAIGASALSSYATGNLFAGGFPELGVKQSFLYALNGSLQGVWVYLQSRS